MVNGAPAKGAAAELKHRAQSKESVLTPVERTVTAVSALRDEEHCHLSVLGSVQRESHDERRKSVAEPALVVLGASSSADARLALWQRSS
jgi:hypothetical protein